LVVAISLLLCFLKPAGFAEQFMAKLIVHATLIHHGDPASSELGV